MKLSSQINSSEQIMLLLLLFFPIFVSERERFNTTLEENLNFTKYESEANGIATECSYSGLNSRCKIVVLHIS